MLPDSRERCVGMRVIGRRFAGGRGGPASLGSEFSAAGPLPSWQRWTLVGIFCALVFGAITAPHTTLAVLLAVLAFPFFCVVILRISALVLMVRRAGQTTLSRSLPDDDLPKYSILVPLYDEAKIVPDLIAALFKIDYPERKLDVQMIVESADPETYAALLEQTLPRHMRINVVPTTSPQTKPRALNHALASAKGDYVVVYDAEDIPDPKQLRQAAAQLMSNPKLGCVQACLNVYNPRESFLSRQFTIEYTALFDLLLPTLRWLGFPVPLGGTSNHFPRKVLEALGGWDAHNVTEDADLGICLARAGLEVEILHSTTWEEAPVTVANWMRQRTRWLKGWMQTYLVHMRRPSRLLNELGVRGFSGLQIFMGGVLLSVLVHPWFYVFAAMDFWAAQSGAGLFDVHPALWWIGFFNLIAGYCAGVALGCAAVIVRGWTDLALSSLWMPVYWLMISFAAYRALWQLLRRPFYWEKTVHRPRSQLK